MPVLCTQKRKERRPIEQRTLFLYTYTGCTLLPSGAAIPFDRRHPHRGPKPPLPTSSVSRPHPAVVIDLSVPFLRYISRSFSFFPFYSFPSISIPLIVFNTSRNMVGLHIPSHGPYRRDVQYI